MTRRAQGHLYRNNGRLQSEQSEFLEITGSRYQNMKTRFREKRDPQGRVVRLGRKLLFTLDEFRDWTIKLFGKSVADVMHGTVRCEYCNWPVDIQRLQLDHRLPAAQGGSLCLSNLAASCGSCNRQKGEMSAPAYMALMKLLNGELRDELRPIGIELPFFSSVDRTDVLARLKRGHRYREMERNEEQ